MKVLLTGASGFVGRALTARLVENNFVDLAVAIRQSVPVSGASAHVIKDLSAGTDWSSALAEQQVVIHTAARAHVLNEKAVDSLAEYRKVNVDGALNLARQAAKAGVRRFIFISSIGVNGNNSTRPFTASDRPNPVEPYAVSKSEAEQGLWRLQQATEMEIVIIRPPLVYGLGAPGNFGRLVRWVQRGVPLPMGAIHNKRSLVGIDNLVDLIIRCIDHPAATNQVLLAGDGEDLSTTELLRGVGKALGKPAKLIPIPAAMLQFGATLLGKETMAQRLLGSLQIDIGETCELLDWKPPYTVQEGLRRCFERTS